MEHAIESLISKLTPGDHIASERHGDQYEHHGIYIGTINGYLAVIHYRAPIRDSRISGTGPSLAKCTTCGFEVPKDGGKVTSCLNCFCRGKRVFIVKYKVKVPCPPQNLTWGNVLRGYRNDKLYVELYDGSRLSGHMKVSAKENLKLDNLVYLSKFHSCRTPEQVLEAAQSDHYSGKYNFLFNNCEDFAVYCMIGKERSIQAKNKLHKVPYKAGKTLHLLKDSKKLKEKIKEKTGRLLNCPHQ